jgi:hypothetical protein
MRAFLPSNPDGWFLSKPLNPGCLLLSPVMPSVSLDRKMRLPLVVLSLGILGFLLSACGWAHYIAPLTCVIFLLLVQAIRHLRTLRPYGRSVGLALSWAVAFLLARDIGS